MNSRFTDEDVFLQRRRFLSIAVKAGLIMSSAEANWVNAGSQELDITPEDKATQYNNYYEFSDNKAAVKALSKDFTTTPWPLSIGGLVHEPSTVDVADLPQSTELIYRFRCVEGWSMVVPWHGFSLNALIEKAKPKKDAKFVRFVSVYRPSEMIGQRRNSLTWPYTEALRLDEAMHPLTILATGMYGKTMPPQNGGPIRLVVPWKYGYKSIKAIERIELVSEMPSTTWTQRAPSEYGFYANVNPSVAHPRWSQRREVPLGQLRKIRTLNFNGYEKQVAHLYENMDLEKFF